MTATEVDGGVVELGGMWLSLAVVLAGAVGTMAAAVAYKVREAARLRLVTESARVLSQGGAVRYRSVDRQGKATAEWEVIIPVPVSQPSNEEELRGVDGGEPGG